MHVYRSPRKEIPLRIIADGEVSMLDFFWKKSFSFTGAGGGRRPGETCLECDKPVLLLVCVNELGLFPSSQSACF